jgi:hypothetical protein
VFRAEADLIPGSFFFFQNRYSGWELEVDGEIQRDSRVLNSATLGMGSQQVKLFLKSNTEALEVNSN